MNSIRVFSKKAIALVVALAVIISSLTTGLMFVATAENEGESSVQAWDGTVATAFAGGDGSLNNPYQIANAEQLAYMYRSVQDSGSAFSNNKHFKLTADIYLNDVTDPDWKTKSPRSWYTSKSDNGYRFTGNFDGNGHTVYGIYYNTTSDYIGLLPVVDNWNYDIYVKDLTISDSYIVSTGSMVGAVASRLYSNNNKVAEFSNISITDTVTVSGKSDGYVGGIIAFSNCNASSPYQFSGCSVLASVSSGKAFIGYGASGMSIKIKQSFTTASMWCDGNSQTGNGIYIVSDKTAIKGKTAAMAQMPDLDWGGLWDCTEDGMPCTTDNSHVWTGLVATSYESGAGTEAAPFVIKTPEQLAKLVKDSNTSGKYYELANDIRINDASKENWTATATPWFTYNGGGEFSNFYFQGTLNGNFHTISGLYYQGSNYYVGLFAGIKGGATINKVIIDNSYLVTDDMVSAFTGYVNGAINYNQCIIGENVTIQGSHASGFGSYGSGNITINNSMSVANITGTSYGGAFLADIWSSTLKINSSIGVGPFSPRRSYTGSNNYGTVADNYGVMVVTKDQMKGAEARINMPTLPWGSYFKADANGGFPIPTVPNPEGIMGEEWTGETATKYASGTGTEDDPFIIVTGEQLARLVKDTNTKDTYYALGADIILNNTTLNNWTSIAKEWLTYSTSGKVYFQGHFDGREHTISGIYYAPSNASWTGLFPGIKENASIKNVTITDSEVNFNSTSAGAGILTSSASGTHEITNCHITETVKINATSAIGLAGLIGSGSATIAVDTCSVRATVNLSSGKYAGAFFGDFWGGSLTVNNSFAVGQPISGRRTFSGSKNYSTVADTNGTNVVSADVMKGNAARTGMPALDWGISWKINPDGGYPLTMIPNPEGTVGGLWSGKEATSFAGGDGTKDNPYLIATGEQLLKMVLDAQSIGTYYELANDIRLNDTTIDGWKDYARGWVWNNNVFQGTFDGAGHTIDGLFYNGPKDKVGLFCYAKNAVIKNVVFTNSHIKSTGFATGTVVGDANAGTVELYKVYVADGYVESTYDADGNKGAGGLIGYGGAVIKVTASGFIGEVKSPANAGAILGNCWAKDDKGTSAVTVSQTFAAAGIKFCTKMGLSQGSDNNYSNCETEEKFVTYVPTENMLGTDAMSNMSGLEWEYLWETTDAYPICKFDAVPLSEKVWSGNVAESFESGTGSETDPYIITNSEQLAKMVLDTENSGKFYKLGKDISLNNTSLDNWTYYARQWIWTGNIFQGTFDGDGHTIDGLYFESTKDKVGLFCYAKNAVIKNLELTNSYVKSTGFATGTVVGDANSGTVELSQVYVANGYVESTFNADSNKGAGGLIGYGGAAINVTASGYFGTVKAPANAGAILGNCWGSNADGSSALVVTQTIGAAGIKFCSKKAISTQSDNNYSNATETENNVINVTTEQMKGEGAMKNMRNLDWGSTWKATEGYPVCRFGESIVSKDAWSGEVAESYQSGSGTEADPFIIVNGEQLAKMVLDTESEGKFYKLGADIMLNDTSLENWTYYARQWIWTNNIFKGNLDGDCHVITGLYFESTKSKVGLLCYAANASLKRIILDNAYVHSSGYATGAFVGDANSGIVTITECYVKENSSVESTYDKDNNKGAGGFVGYGGATVEIEGSAYLGTVSAPAYAGAFIGNSWTSQFKDGTWSRVIVTNSFATPELKYSPKQKLAGDAANNYSPSKEEEPGLNYVALSAMKGSAAQKNMPLLNWTRTWKTSDGFPVLNVGEYEGVKGKVWSGRLAKDYAGGSGTASDPYLIETAEQLAKLVAKVTDSKGKYYKLTADIYLNDISKPNWENTANDWFWVSTARYGNFNGNFNGDGHVIYGLYLDLEPQNSVIYTGLFPTISDGTVVEKVGFSNCHIKVANNNVDIQSYVGAIAGVVFLNQSEAETDPANLPRISQCFGDSKTILEGRYVGGLVGGGSYVANMDNCYFIGEVIGERVGAIVGNTWTNYEGSTIKNSYSATNAVDIFSGGRAGVQNSSSPINYKDNYSNCTGLANFVTHMSTIMMRGDAAKKNMSALDFDKIWYAVENGTPVLRIFGTTDKFSNTTDPKPIEVSFVTNGGSECPTAYGNPEEKLDLPTPVREGYKFEGWYVYKELDIPFTFDYFPYFDTILYAKWSPLGIIQDFENYENSPYDYGSDYEYYRPGTVGYDAAYVKSGMASMHRKGETKKDADFLLNYMDLLTVGNKYKMTFYVTTDVEGTGVDLSMVHEDFPDVFDTDSGVEFIKTLKNMKAGEWQQVEVTFTAKTKWLAIRTSGNASVFFEDFMVLPTEEDIAPEANTSASGSVMLYVVIGLAVLVLAGAGAATVVIIKKRKNKI